MANYNEEAVLREYLIQWYRDLMTDIERDVVRGSTLLLKNHEKSSAVVEKKLADIRIDPQANEILELGAKGARQWVADRLLDRCGDQITVNRCPSCKRIVRTPLAQQCLWCGQDWHGKAPD